MTDFFEKQALIHPSPPSQLSHMEVLQSSSPTVEWHASVWYKERTPKHTFIAWIVARNILETRDKLRIGELMSLRLASFVMGWINRGSTLFFECSYIKSRNLVLFHVECLTISYLTSWFGVFERTSVGWCPPPFVSCWVRKSSMFFLCWSDPFVVHSALLFCILFKLVRKLLI